MMERGTDQSGHIATVDAESAERVALRTVGVANGQKVVTGGRDVGIAGDAGVVAGGKLDIAVGSPGL